MGDFVDSVSGNIVVPIPTVPDKIHEQGNFTPAFAVTPSGPWSLVRDRFDQSMTTAEQMLEKLIGGSGNEGYLNELSNIISELSSSSIDAISYKNVLVGDISTGIQSLPIKGATTLPNAVLGTYIAPTEPNLTTTDLTVSLPDAPSFTGNIDTDFGTFDAVSPSMTAIPEIDLGSLLATTMPEDVTAAVSWFNDAHNTELYTPLFDRLLSDLQTGVSGIGSVLEQEAYDRAVARLNIEENKAQTEIEEYFSNTGFDLPTGAIAARLQEQANSRAMRYLDLNSQIAIEQAELIQKNNQFIIDAALKLETVLRDHTNKENDRALDYSKAVAANAIAIYAERVKAYVAALEANKTYVSIQVENLKAVIEANKAAVSIYEAEAKVYEITVDAKAKKNEAVTDIYKAEISGYGIESGAATEVFKARIQEQDSINSAITERYKANVNKFSAESNAGVEAYKAELDGINAYNTTIVDSFKAEVVGYEAENNAILANRKLILDSYALKLQDAENELKAAVSAAEVSISGYGTEYSLREKVAEAMANVAMQAMSSAYGAVNSSAGLSYSAGESVSESWSHGESRSDNYSHSESISANSSVSNSLSNSLTETHTFEEN